jgi:hypothetical protein
MQMLMQLDWRLMVCLVCSTSKVVKVSRCLRTQHGRVICLGSVVVNEETPRSLWRGQNVDIKALPRGRLRPMRCVWRRSPARRMGCERRHADWCRDARLVERAAVERCSRCAPLHGAGHGSGGLAGVGTTQDVLDICAREAPRLRGGRSRADHRLNLVGASVWPPSLTDDCVTGRRAGSATRRLRCRRPAGCCGITNTAHAELGPVALILINNLPSHRLALQLGQPLRHALVLVMELVVL